MEKDTRFKHMVEMIDAVLETQIGGTKTETLARQRGYLTGWLARLAVKDWTVQEEIRSRYNLSQNKKNGAL